MHAVTPNNEALIKSIAREPGRVIAGKTYFCCVHVSDPEHGVRLRNLTLSDLTPLPRSTAVSAHAHYRDPLKRKRDQSDLEVAAEMAARRAELKRANELRFAQKPPPPQVLPPTAMDLRQGLEKLKVVRLPPELVANLEQGTCRRLVVASSRRPSTIRSVV